MDEFAVTTILDYPDRYEGQVIHKGDLPSCEKVSGAIAAVSISGGGDPPASASLRIVEARHVPDPGVRWCMSKGDSSDA